MEHLPPPPVPFRPDLVTDEFSPRRRFPVWVVAVCVLLALSLGALAVAPLFGGRSPRRVPVSSSSIGPTRASRPAGTPVQPIHYVVNASLAPPGSIADVHEAVRRVSAATGIAFEYEGPPTRRPPSIARCSSPTGTATGGPPS